MDAEEIKQVIIVRRDLEMGKGKMAAQVAHAAVGSLQKTGRKIAEKWESMGAKKVVLAVDSLPELLELEKNARKLPHFLVTDAGRTEFKEPTITCLGIGPATAGEIDRITGNLKLMK